MRNWFLVAFCAAILCQFVIGIDLESTRNSAIESMREIRNLFLHQRESEIALVENILLFPVFLATEVELEYNYQEKINSSDLAKLWQATRMERGFPIVLKWFYNNFKDAAGLYLSRRETLYPPAEKPDIYDRDQFAYKSFVIWLKTHQDKEAAAKASLFPPFLTMATLRINSLLSEPFKWTRNVAFFTAESRFTDAVAMRNIGYYDYAEFKYPHTDHCYAGALRLKVSSRLSMIFIISLTRYDKWCNSAEYLLRLLEDKAFDTIRFTYQRTYLSIPMIRAASIVHPARHLKHLGLIRTKPNESEPTPTSGDRYLSMALVFEPEIPPGYRYPTAIPSGVTIFDAEQTFLVAVFQDEDQAPFLQGLIQRPSSDA